MPLALIVSIEDARTAAWLEQLDPATDPVRRIDMGWTMGDWNQLDVSITTVAMRMSCCPIVFTQEPELAPPLTLGRLDQASRVGRGTTHPNPADMAGRGPALLVRARRRTPAEHCGGQADARGGGERT